MKRTPILIATLITLLAAFSALAQQGPGPGPGGPKGDPLADYLQLTADQRSAWQTAHQDFNTATQALRDQQQALHDQLGTALQGTDACAIGNLMLQIRSIGDQIQAAHDALEQQLLSVLTPEQKAKFDAFKAAVAFLNRPGPGGPPPQGGPRP